MAGGSSSSGTTTTATLVADAVKEPRVGGFINKPTKNGTVYSIPYCGNNGGNPGTVEKFKARPTQQRLEEVFASDKDDAERWKALPEAHRLELESTVDLQGWIEESFRHATVYGFDYLYWVPEDGVIAATSKYYHICLEFDDIQSDWVEKFVKTLKEGVTPGDPCSYDLANMEYQRDHLLGSVGTKLYDKVIKGGTRMIDGPVLLYKIVEAYGVGKMVEIKCLIAEIKKSSIKDDPTKDYGKLSLKLITALNRLHSLNKEVVENRNVGEDVVEALSVDDEWFQQNVHNPLIKDTIGELIKAQHGKELTYEVLEKALSTIQRTHTQLTKTDHYPAAKLKPNKQAEQLKGLLAQAYKAGYKQATGESPPGNKNQGTGGGGGGGQETRTCYGCGQKGHLKNDPKCPKYKAKPDGSKSESPGSSSNSDSKSRAAKRREKEKEKNPWKFTKTENKITRSGNEYYWCPECNMYTTSHGLSHPDGKVHIKKEKKSSQTEGGHLAEMEDILSSISANSNIDFGTPGGLYFGAIFDGAEDGVYPKGRGSWA